MNIVFLDRSTFAPEVRFPTDTLGDCRWRDYPVTRSDEVMANVAAFMRGESRSRVV